MDYTEFLTRVVDEGIEAATSDYTKESDKQNLEGSIAGFNACRNKSPEELIEVWNEASKKMNEAFGEQKDNYWYFRCFQLEVEWVCNVVSAMLMNEGHTTPLLSWLPTANGAMKAASIVGVAEALLISENTPDILYENAP
jgi:hypothetical protein